jgi:hypothetical protein
MAMSDDLITSHPSRAARRRPRDERARRFKRDLIKVAPHLDDPMYGPLIHSFARISILTLDACDYLRLNGIVGADGELRPSCDVVQRLINSQLRLANALGLSPAARQALAKVRGDDTFAAAMAGEE